MFHWNHTCTFDACALVQRDCRASFNWTQSLSFASLTFPSQLQFEIFQFWIMRWCTVSVALFPLVEGNAVAGGTCLRVQQVDNPPHIASFLIMRLLKKQCDRGIIIHQSQYLLLLCSTQCVPPLALWLSFLPSFICLLCHDSAGCAPDLEHVALFQRRRLSQNSSSTTCDPLTVHLWSGALCVGLRLTAQVPSLIMPMVSDAIYSVVSF